MSISIKSKKDIEKMKIAGRKATSVLEMLKNYVVPGVSTAELDSLAFKFITEELKCIPANIGYGGFPKTLCTSINNVICHGIPSETKILKTYGDTLRIEYEPQNINAAENMASEYCLSTRSKVSTKNEVSCDGCCRATFICKTIPNPENSKI